MRKIICKILLFFLLISFTVEITIPVFHKENSVSLIMCADDSEEKKDSDKKEKEEDVKDKNAIAIKFLSAIDIVTAYRHINHLIKTQEFLSLPDIPPDQA